MQKNEIKKALLRKLMYLGKWNNAHTAFNNLPKGFPKHLRGKVKGVAKECIKEKLLLTKPTAYGLEVSLNAKKKKEIEEITTS